jgi:hypothetical protein
MLPPAPDRPKLDAVLGQLSDAVEGLTLSGLTTASDSTREAVAVAIQEAARLKLLRLGATLRVVAEELGRFTRQDPGFSRRRLTFFLNRTWVLARGIAQALRAGDEASYDRLTLPPPADPLPEVEVVTLGAVKKVTSAFVSFDFRLRATAGAGSVSTGQRLSWSVVFPVRPGVEMPAEGFLHLPQKQKFTPSRFLDGTTLVVREATVSPDGYGGGRLALTDRSTVTVGKPFSDWARFLDWSPGPAAERIARHMPSPLDLETELQEEVVLRDYEIGPPADGPEPGQTTYPVAAGPLAFQAVVGPDPEGTALRKGLDALRKPKAKRPPLFGLVHYERCRLVLQPLTTIADAGPDYLTISKESINKAALLKAMTFA